MAAGTSAASAAGAFGGKPKVDNSAQARANQLAEAEAKAAREKADLEAKRKAEESALRRGLRGSRQLFSGGGGFIGFPEGGKSTLGG